MIIGGAVSALRVTIPGACQRLDCRASRSARSGSHTILCVPHLLPPVLSAHQTFYVNDLHTVDYRPERFPFERLRRVNFDPNLCIA
jgi:hypothetical protein